MDLSNIFSLIYRLSGTALIQPAAEYEGQLAMISARKKSFTHVMIMEPSVFTNNWSRFRDLKYYISTVYHSLCICVITFLS